MQDIDERVPTLKLRLAYKFFIDIGVTKNFLYYLQFELSIKSMDFIAALMEISERGVEKFRFVQWIFNKILSFETHLGTISLSWTRKQGKVFDHFDELLAEFCLIVEDYFGKKPVTDEIRALCRFQSLIQPTSNKRMLDISLPYDFHAYFQQIRKGIPLASEETAALVRPLKAFQCETVFRLLDHPRLHDNSLAFSEAKQVESPWLIQYESTPGVAAA